MKKSLLLLAVVWAGSSVWAGEIGAVSGVVGSPTIAGQVARMDTKIQDGDEVITGPGEAVALCLDSKVVIKLDARTALKVRELAEKTDIQLEHGKARVYIAKRDAGRPVVMTDPKASVEAHGTVFLGDFNSDTQNSSYSVDESSVTVNSGGQTTNVGAGQQANYSVGQLLGLGASTGGVGGTMGSLDQTGRQQSVVTQQTQAANVAAFAVLNVGRTSNVTPVEGNTNTQGNNSNSNNGNGTNENAQAPAGGTQAESTQQVAPPLATYNVGSLNTGAGTPPIPAGTVQNQTVMNLVQSGTVPGLPPTPVTSTGGFSDVTARLSALGTLDFLVRDNGIPDGDIVNVSVTSSTGSTLLSQQNVSLTAAGQSFSPKASVGTVDIHIVSVSDGQVPPNTGQVTVSNVATGKVKQSYGINAGDEAILHVTTQAAAPAGGPRPRVAIKR